MRTMLGKEKANQLAKLITSPFSGNILHQKIQERWRDERRRTSKHSILLCLLSDVHIKVLLVDLALEDDVGGRAGERGRASDAGRVAHAQTHPLGQD